MKITRFTFFILLAASVCWTGCEMFTSHTNPIAGWKGLSSRASETLDKAITVDYQDYIQKLPPKERNGLTESSIWFFEDGTGQHAVEFETGRNGTSYAHVLIYDKDNKRIKAMKYISGHYAS